MRSRKIPASGPWTSILPRVLASIDRDRRRASPRPRASTASSIDSLGVDREVARPLPLADVLEDGAARRRARPGSRSTRIGSARSGPRSRPATWANADRHERRPEGRHADRADVLAEQPGGDRAGHDPADAALFDARADRRVALDVLDRLEAGAQRPAQVGDGAVATRVDVVVAQSSSPSRRWRDDPGRLDRAEAAMSPAAAPTAVIGVGRRGGVRDEAGDALVEAQRAAGWAHSATFGFQPPDTSEEVRLDRPAVGRADRRRGAVGASVRAHDRPRRGGRRRTATTSAPASASAASTSRVVSLS